MIPFDFSYHRPDTPDQAAALYDQLERQQAKPFYYGGGSEIITMSRAGSIAPGAVIDIKAIPECNVLDDQHPDLVIGSAVSLEKIAAGKTFPLLGKACGRIADHSNQCRITLGGNVCGTIIYRETSLPLLLAETDVLLAGPGGRRTVPFAQVFHRRMQLLPGEMVVQFIIKNEMLNTDYFHIKKTTNEKIDYPLVTVCAMLVQGRLRIAFSGICAFPFRSAAIEALLNDHTASVQSRIQALPALLPDHPHSDAEGSAGYRVFVLQNTVSQLLKEVKP